MMKMLKVTRDVNVTDNEIPTPPGTTDEATVKAEKKDILLVIKDVFSYYDIDGFYQCGVTSIQDMNNSRSSMLLTCSS